MKIILIFVFLVSAFSHATDTSSVWGKIILSEKVIKDISYKYFIYFKKDGVTQAYPLETTRNEMAALAKKNVGKSVRINGEVKEVSLVLDGPPRKILVFIPSEIKPLTLGELSSNEPVNMLPNKVSVGAKRDKAPYEGGLRISDTAANAMIYTGAAVMLGTLLFKK